MYRIRRCDHHAQCRAVNLDRTSIFFGSCTPNQSRHVASLPIEVQNIDGSPVYFVGCHEAAPWQPRRGRFCAPFHPSILPRRRTLPWPPTPRRREVCLARDSPQQPELYQVLIRSFRGIPVGVAAVAVGAQSVLIITPYLYCCERCGILRHVCTFRASVHLCILLPAIFSYSRCHVKSKGSQGYSIQLVTYVHPSLLRAMTCITTVEKLRARGSCFESFWLWLNVEQLCEGRRCSRSPVHSQV